MRFADRACFRNGVSCSKMAASEGWVAMCVCVCVFVFVCVCVCVCVCVSVIKWWHVQMLLRVESSNGLH